MNTMSTFKSYRKLELDSEIIQLVLKLRLELNWSIPSIAFKTNYLKNNQVASLFK